MNLVDSMPRRLQAGIKAKDAQQSIDSCVNIAILTAVWIIFGWL